MNAPGAGWHADPTGRHEHRYWDGANWTDDVADAGVSAVDPVDAAAGIGADPTSVIDATQAYTPQPGPQPGGLGPQPGYDPMYGSGQTPPSGRPPKAGPSMALVVGLAAVAVALIVGLVVALGGGGDGDDTASTDGTSQTTEDTSSGDTTDDTSSDDPATEDNTDDDNDDDTDDSGSSDVLVDAMATELENSGVFDREQAECVAQAMLDGIGIERMAEIGESGGDISSLTPEEQAAIFSTIGDCGLTGMPGLGEDDGG